MNSLHISSMYVFNISLASFGATRSISKTGKRGWPSSCKSTKYFWSSAISVASCDEWTGISALIPPGKATSAHSRNGARKAFLKSGSTEAKLVISLAFGVTDALLSLVATHTSFSDCGNSLERLQVMVCIPVCSLNEEDGLAILTPIPSSKVVERLHNTVDNVFLVSAVWVC